MSAPDLDPELMNRFRRSGAENHVTLLIGAGASTGSGLPNWRELARRLLLESSSVESGEAADLLLQHQDELLAAEAAKARLGVDWGSVVRRVLYQGPPTQTPSALHRAVVGYALSGDSEDTTLLTLNFDTLLESAFHHEGENEAKAVATDNHKESLPVYHLHGIVDRRCAPEGLALTLSDFNELIGAPDTWQLRVLKECVRKGALLIAGTSYRDPDLRHWLHEALREQPQGHEAIVLLAREAFGLSRADFATVRDALEDQWRAVGLEPVIVEEFTDAGQILRELRHIDAPSYLSPQERAQSLWAAHERSFGDLQKQYAEQLSKESGQLKQLFGAERLNLSLWLAEGDGNLVRWASQDRIYCDPTQLRRVPSGHDSPWIAGRVLGADDTRFQDLPEGGPGRWGTVLATPIRVEIRGLPYIAAAVLSVGLPGKAEDYVGVEGLWGEEILDIANDWSRRLGSADEIAECSTLDTERE
ncbi:SIR2 family protein [Nesterenkonia alkaliphila]|nr:SIR2 family protein [Nesterenkonia alkaliphila]GFZ84604.1 hypothetical protein GCM10011359_12000 [Nesterenkonia alkaliphila]